MSVLVSGFPMKCARHVGPDAPDAHRNGGPRTSHNSGPAGTTERRRRIDTGQVAGYGECPSGPASGLAHRRAPSSRDGPAGSGGTPPP